ncbi:MAG: dynamin family protein [Sulfurospirillum sp.]
MHIQKDFFLLGWGEDSDSIEELPVEFSEKIDKTFIDNYEEFCDACSILFIINSENFEKIVQIREFKSIFDGLFSGKTIEKCLILQTQKKVLQFIVKLGNLELNSTLKTNFEVLRKEGIITYYISRRLIGLFALIKKREIAKEQIHLEVATQDKNFYKNSLNLLETSISNLSSILEVKTLKQKLDMVEKKLKSEKFSIGVTGVINAGKSTLLNALLKEEILGTSVIPETANLSILKYSKDRYAKVNFWSKAEFARIEKSAKELKSIEKFIKETKSHFGKSLDKYVQEESRSQKVNMEDLSLYTSAGKSDMKCNLVKSVEIYSELEFLKDGVEIVDTPGLDDPIIQREEITREYVSECDLMMHLMSVNQSATQKDVDFIIDSIIYQNISRLLVVITRIDTVTQEELDEVISYTKKSIKNRLKEQNKSYKFDSIIKKIEFIPVSGKMALFLKTGQEELAQKNGYDLEKSGILNIERYLRRMLFGPLSQKVNLIIQGNKNELLSIIEASRKIFEEEELLLGKSNLEIKEEYKRYLIQKDEMVKVLYEVKKMINRQEIELREYFKTLHKYLHEKLIVIKNITKTRIIDDVSYGMRKNKKIPKKERIDYMVETALKDGLIDLIREYRYEFQKRMKNSFDILTRALRFDFEGGENLIFDSREFFERNFKTLKIFQNRSVLLAKIYEIITRHAKKSPQKLEMLMDELLQKNFDDLWELLAKKIEKTDIELLDNFIEINKIRVLDIENDMLAKENLLQSSMRIIKNSFVSKEQREVEIATKKEALSVIKDDLKVLNESI